MIKIYVPTSALTNSQWLYGGVTASGDWSQVSPGSPCCFGGVVTADHRYDKNGVAVSGNMGNRHTYTFVPFVLKNELPSPHTYCYGVGYSQIYTAPSTVPTGSGFNMSNDATKDASNSATLFPAYEPDKYGVFFLGMGSGNSIWNLSNSLWINSNAMETISGKMTLPPNILIRGIEWHESNNLSPQIAISRTDSSLGFYNRKTWGNNAINASGTISPSGGQEIHLYRDNFIFGFMYFYVGDNDTTNEAATDYFTPTLSGGYPTTSNFQTQTHGKWIEPDLSGQIFTTNKSTYWNGSNASVQTRESRIGLYFAGRRVN